MLFWILVLLCLISLIFFFVFKKQAFDKPQMKNMMFASLGASILCAVALTVVQIFGGGASDTELLDREYSVPGLIIAKEMKAENKNVAIISAIKSSFCDAFVEGAKKFSGDSNVKVFYLDDIYKGKKGSFVMLNKKTLNSFVKKNSEYKNIIFFQVGFIDNDIGKSKIIKKKKADYQLSTFLCAESAIDKKAAFKVGYKRPRPKSETLSGKTNQEYFDAMFLFVK